MFARMKTTRLSQFAFPNTPYFSGGVIDIFADSSWSKKRWRRMVWSLADNQRRRSAKCVFRFGFDPLDQGLAGGDIMNQSDDLASSPYLCENLVWQTGDQGGCGIMNSPRNRHRRSRKLVGPVFRLRMVQLPRTSH